MSHPPTPRTVRPTPTGLRATGLRATRWRATGLRALLCGVVLLCAANVAPGRQDDGTAVLDGPDRAFLEGLRDRGMADLALLELDRIAADDGASAELKTVLPYERAVTLLSLAGAGGPGVDVGARLSEAAGLLKTFAQNNPNHPLAGDAQFLQAEILQQKAADLLGSGDPVDLPESTKTEARRQLDQAKDVYGRAISDLKRTLDDIGAFVDDRDDAALARRNRAEARLIRARVEAARVVFRQAQTYPVGSPDRDRLLDEADAPLEDLHNDYRRKIGAFPGRILQGQIHMARVPDADDEDALRALSDAERTAAKQQLTKAESLLAEVANKEMPSGAGAAVRDAVERLRGTAQRLRLSVLNHPLKADHATVVAQATDWLNADRARGGTDEGAAVIFQRGIAHERGAPEEEGRDRTSELRAALTDFQTAARRSDAVSGVANLAADRVRGKLGLDRQEPRNFAEAFDAAQPLLRQLSEKQTAVRTAEAAGDESAVIVAQEELDALLAQLLPLLNAANDFADANTDRTELSRARYQLAYVNVLTGRYYEAAVLAEYVARNFIPPEPDPENPEATADQLRIPLDAASTAAQAWTQAYQNRPSKTDGSFELSQLGEIADWIAQKYPNSDRASKARVTLGRVLLSDGQLVDAARVFASVPESDPDYADAQLKAGDALWRRSVELTNMATPPPGESADDYKQRARERLETGVQKAEAKLSGEPSAQLLIGKATLAQIYNGEGQFDQAIEQLSGGPGGRGKVNLQEAVKVADGEDRPAKGIKSALFAKLVYQQLLRAQIGRGDTDAAQETIADIQTVSEGGNIGLFRSLGEQIQDELDAMPPGPERDAARDNLVAFLKKIADSDDQTFGSLMWIAETYAGLAESLPEGDSKAATYFNESAAALQTSLQNLPAGDSQAGAESAVRLRLAEVFAGAGQFEQGFEQVQQVIAAKPNALNAQTTAANLLADWGEAKNEPAKLVQSLTGDEAAGVWGWGQLSQTLARQLSGPNAEQFQPEYNAARLRIPQVRAAIAETKSGEERTEEYVKAERELLSWITLTDPANIAADTRDEAEELYRDLQTARGVADPQPLPTDIGTVAAAPAPEGGDDSTAPAAAATSPAAAAEEADDGPNVVLLIVGIVVLALITAGAIFAFRPKPRKRAARRSTGKARDDGATHEKMRGHGMVRSSLPEVAPLPAAAPAAAAAPTGTGFPDFSALPQKKASRPAAGTAPRTRSGSKPSGSGSTGKTRRPSSSGSSSTGSSSSGKTRRSSSGTTPDGKTVRRRSSSSGSSSSGSSGSSSSESSEPPRKRRPKPPAE